MKLRDYQQQLINNIYTEWANGHRAVLMQLETGGGKTVTFTEIIAQRNEPTCVIAHRTELIHQAALTLARRGLSHAIIGANQTLRDCVAIQMRELKKSYVDPSASIQVASIDTLTNLSSDTKWVKDIKLVVIDEAHHVLRKNKWGKTVDLFPKARFLLPTATPARSDNMGLGSHADGIADIIVEGPPMRWLIEQGALCDYRVAVPPRHLELANIPISGSGDYSPKKLSEVVKKAHLTGDIIDHYLKLAPGKLGITFAVDIEAATEIAAAYRAAGVPAEVVSSKTPPLIRAQIMQKFKNREILQLVNVDILGEGVDVPAVEVISLARPTQSFVLYKQQFGRGLRPLKGKSYCLTIDHAGNVMRHGFPDDPREWSLDRIDKRIKRIADNIVKIRTCTNCFLVYSRELSRCSYCGHSHTPTSRTSIEHVDGDLILLDSTMIAKMRGNIEKIDTPMPMMPWGLSTAAQYNVVNNHRRRQTAQTILREFIALYAGFLKAQGYDDSKIYRKFYLTFGIDIMSAQALGRKPALALTEKIKNINRTVFQNSYQKNVKKFTINTEEDITVDLKPGFHLAGDNLFLRFKERTFPSYLFQMEYASKRYSVTLGKAKEITLEFARTRAKEMREEVLAGKDPTVLKPERFKNTDIPSLRVGEFAYNKNLHIRKGKNKALWYDRTSGKAVRIGSWPEMSLEQALNCIGEKPTIDKIINKG